MDVRIIVSFIGSPLEKLNKTIWHEQNQYISAVLHS